jgi:hypothetical protein
VKDAEVEPAKMVMVLAPEDWTVTAPVELLTTIYLCPAATEVVGNLTVWVVEPVKYCCGVSAIVRVVVPAAVAVVAYPSRKELAVRFALASLEERVEAVAEEETPEPVGRPVKTGVVRVGVVPKTRAPLPVSSETEVIKLEEEIDPEAVPYRVPEVGKVTLVVPVEVRVVPKFPESMRAAEALFGMVSVPAVEVMVSPLTVVAVAAPKVGVTRVGEVEYTRFVEAVPVVPVAALR